MYVQAHPEYGWQHFNHQNAMVQSFLQVRLLYYICIYHRFVYCLYTLRLSAYFVRYGLPCGLLSHILSPHILLYNLIIEPFLSSDIVYDFNICFIIDLSSIFTVFCNFHVLILSKSFLFSTKLNNEKITAIK
jgi:hypothetical protein